MVGYKQCGQFSSQQAAVVPPHCCSYRSLRIQPSGRWCWSVPTVNLDLLSILAFQPGGSMWFTVTWKGVLAFQPGGSLGFPATLRVTDHCITVDIVFALVGVTCPI